MHVSLITRIRHYAHERMSSLHRDATFTFCSSLHPPPGLSLCLTGECVERLPVWMLLLSAFLAPDLQGTEEKSSNPRLLLLSLLIFSQIHCPDFPAGGTLGLDARWAPSLPRLRHPCCCCCCGLPPEDGSRFNHTSSRPQPLPATSESWAGTESVLHRRLT